MFSSRSYLVLLFVLGLLVLSSCATDTLVARVDFEGKGAVSYEREHDFVGAVDGWATAGVYQVDDFGELRLTRPLLEVYSRAFANGERWALDKVPLSMRPIFEHAIGALSLERLGVVFVPDEDLVESPSPTPEA